MTMCSSILAWKIPWTKEPGRSLWGHKELDTAVKEKIDKLDYTDILKKSNKMIKC